jgi:hypothetical protein
MSEISVNLGTNPSSAAVATNLITRDSGTLEHMQIMNIGDPQTDGNYASVDDNGNLSVNVVNTATVAFSGTPGVAVVNIPTVVVSGAFDVAVTNQPTFTLAGSANVIVANTPTVTISGTPTMAITNTPNVSVTNTPNVSVTNTPNVTIVGTPQVNVTNMPEVTILGTPNVNLANLVAKGIQATNLLGVQDAKDSGRNLITLIANNLAANSSDTVATFSVFKSGTNNGSLTNYYNVTSGKTFRITNIDITAISTSAASNFFTFRTSLSSGVINTGSPAFYQTFLNSASNLGSHSALQFTDGLEFYNGCVGFSYNAQATSCYVYICGYEY